MGTLNKKKISEFKFAEIKKSQQKKLKGGDDTEIVIEDFLDL